MGTGPALAALAVAMAFSAFGAGYGIAAVRARRLARERGELLEDVGLLQRALLPQVKDKVGAMLVSVAYRPCNGPCAGGDFYEALELPDGRAAFILGDVSGHGRAALGHTAFIRYTLRAYLEAGLEPREVLQVGGRIVDPHLGGGFATVVIAIHDPRSGTLTYAAAGHPAPIVVGPTRPEQVLVGSSPPIGLDMRTGLRQTTLPLPPGSIVCLYTDGIAEARTTTRRILGRPRLGDMVEAMSPSETASDLLEDVIAGARIVTDDMVALVMRPTGLAAVTDERREQLEVNANEARTGLAQRFAEVCGVAYPESLRVAAEAERQALEHGAALMDVRYGASGPTRTSILPMLSPASNPMNAAGMLSIPSTTVS